MTSRFVAGIAVAAALGVVAGTGATVWYLGSQTAEQETVAAPPTTSVVPAPPQYGPPLVPGKYNFNILGGNTVPVQLDPCGDGCLVLNAPPSEGNPAGFSQQVKLDGSRYVGRGANEQGIVCASDGKPRAAENQYSVNKDGTNGRVEVLGQPCGADAPNIPLVFTLTPAPAP